ncbi:polysaccharide biosynthesis C-terminal domain-containing protein [Streptococcus parasuis]|uniref:lipopolysaccharide biosynthesis protein n=1 Tax=Streptococcus parasuis TaxID=1501662 RepID=UPI001C1FECEA|nr:polysaccharide biosynthesis C-terminal domain-containing protein [Streptococcus parasuis]QWV86856.1 polysaccharide biosynthesis C-terminal domain-containing protein [Streptococcus parasuis]
MDTSQISQYKSNYLWNLLGSVSSALISTLLLLIASRELGASQSDIFSIVYSISQQLIIIGLFQVRNYQATDVSGRISFTDYFFSRIITILLMLLSACVFLFFQKYSLEKTLIYIFIVLYRACDAFSDVYQGQLQQNRRSDLAGKILFFRSIIAIVNFFIILKITESLVITSFGIFLVNALLTIILDIPILRESRITGPIKFEKNTISSTFLILKQCFPLFLNGFIITYIFTEPKLVIDQLLSRDIFASGMQRNFNILFMPTFILNLLFIILRPMITELSYDWENKKFDIFNKKVKNISKVLLFFGLFTIIFSYFIGTFLLSFVFGVDLNSYSIELVVLILAGLFNVFATMIDNLMTIFRRQKLLLPVYIITFIISKILNYPLIFSFGVSGAAISFLISMVIYFVLSIIIYFYSFQKLIK